MTQFEFYKSFQFIIELLVAEGIFLYNLSLRKFAVFRIMGGVALTFVFSYFFPLVYNSAFYTSMMFFVLFAFTVLVAVFIFNESWLKIVFCCIAGYTLQHLAYEFYNLSLNIMNVNADSPMGQYGSQALNIFPNAFIAIVYFYIYIVSYYFAWFLLGNRIQRGEKLQIKSIFMFMLVLVIVAVDIILNAFVVHNLAPEGNRAYLIIVGVYNSVCCIVALVLQFELSLRYKLEETLNTVKLLRHKEKEQYALSKETIELINIKCHDLKHQIRSIGSRSSISEDSVKEIENLISIYDSTVRTGNEVLDVILTEKKLHCTKKNIGLSCIVDGQRLKFMKDSDIYSLFGNLLDNAIEAVSALDDGKRIIGLRVRAVGDLLSINAHNYYENKLTLDNGIPETTKKDKQYHGFGLKSIKYVCDKYGGDLSINTQNNVFTVNILFPLATN